jgi:hypothetical protein
VAAVSPTPRPPLPGFPRAIASGETEGEGGTVRPSRPSGVVQDPRTSAPCASADVRAFGGEPTRKTTFAITLFDLSTVFRTISDREFPRRSTADGGIYTKENGPGVRGIIVRRTVRLWVGVSK